ncbi:hypothetical protein KPH14_005385 [Odynerus spinipes]|uniref:26S proteasome non-ATPase regulatory subunit 5 n=1 Tax=Odynerus spinipes TaxID=1348599 RepID=A0AAD9RBL6_9HYME|nr:hypothetical protein KPH14_005385 [Odynerus spinipes]
MIVRGLLAEETQRGFSFDRWKKDLTKMRTVDYEDFPEDRNTLYSDKQAFLPTGLSEVKRRQNMLYAQSFCPCESQYEIRDLGEGHYPRHLTISRCKPKACQDKFNSCMLLKYMVHILSQRDTSVMTEDENYTDENAPLPESLRHKWQLKPILIVLAPTMAEWFQAKISRLVEVNSNEEKKDILAEIKIKLGSLNNAEIEGVARSLEASCLFSLLTFDDRDIIEQVCSILKSLFEVFEPGEIYQRYPTEMFQLLSNTNIAVRELILKELLSMASNPQKQLILLADINLLVTIINKLGDEDLTIAKSATCIIKEIGKNMNGLKMLYSGEPLRTFAKLVVKNDVASFRAYDLIVDIAKNSKEALEATIQSGFLNSLINILQNDDILLQLNALEALTELALTEEGLNYLEQQDVLKGLVQKIAQANENPLSNLLIPGLMKFFGNVARLWPNEIFSKYPIVVSALFEVLDSEDQTIVGIALDTLGHVSSGVEGKYALQALGDSMPYTMKKIAEIVQRSPTTLRIHGLNNLALILNVPKTEQDNRILSLTKSWFDALGDDSLGIIVALCKQPFADIRSASLKVLMVVASQAWGQEYISTHPGLIEFLLDRNIEAFKECKETKFKVVECLSQAEPYIFDAGTMQKLKQFVNEGPYYIETFTEVAFEGAT